MSRTYMGRNGAVIVSLIVAMMLALMPLPGGMSVFRPDWVALMMILWAMTVPRAYGVGVAWVIGLVLDVAQGSLLGQHAQAAGELAHGLHLLALRELNFERRSEV